MKQTYDRVDLAKEQLDVALELFLSGRSFVSTLTLAGAAEEIFGKTLDPEGKKTTLGELHGYIAPIKELMRRKPFLEEYINEKNCVRNAAKHIGKPVGEPVIADMADEALSMLVRARGNYSKLGFPVTDRIAEFDAWFYRNVIGMDDY